jgi:DNA-binding NtrC family response regulator
MAESRSLLVVDDDSAMREMLASLFQDEGWQVSEAGNVDAALELVSENDHDVVVSDIRMPGRSGIELVGELRRLRPDTPVVLMTAFGSIDSAVEAMRAGACDYITKPFEPDIVQLTVEKAYERRSLEQENRRLRRAVDETGALGELIGESAAMHDVFALVRKVAHGRSSVLITGESGTGKEMVARAIHFHGSRAQHHFVPVNCTAIPEGLLESELFGHVKGAFTGAHTSKRGLFEEADGGTLFLDEIGDMGPVLQSKILRALQDREIRPVGGNKSVHVDVRIIAATNRDLNEEISEGRFREDLFYRLNVIPIHLPPLRERPEDVAPLALSFLRKHPEESDRVLSPDAARLLAAQPWKGNVRELENALERIIALSEDRVITAEDVRLALQTSGPAESAASVQASLRSLALDGVSLRDLERLYTDIVLEQTGGNQMQASRVLGIDRKTLYRRNRREASNG